MRLTTTLAVVFVAVTGFQQVASGAILSYANFADTNGLTLNGSAGQAGTAIRLASGGCNGGSFFTNQRYSVQAFSAHFTFQITNRGGISDDDGIPGGDGFTFALQTVQPNIVGAGGSWLGYASGGIGTAPIITPSVAVEFDTFGHIGTPPSYGPFDPNGNHIGIDLNGDVSHQPGSPPTVILSEQLDGGQVWHAWVDYNGQTLEVRANTTGVRPDSPLLSAMLDLPGNFGRDDAYLGFTGATCAAWGTYDILSLNYAETSPVPEPSSLIVWSSLGAVGLGMALYRRRKTA